VLLKAPPPPSEDKEGDPPGARGDVEQRNELKSRAGTQGEPQLGRVWLLITGLALAATLLYLQWGRHAAAASEGSLPWWILAVAFFLSESHVIDLPVKHQSHAFSLSELPLTIGVFFLSPALLMLAALVGVLPALIFKRKQRGIKLVFNMTLLVLEVNVACLVFSALTPSADPLDPASWIAAFVSAVTACFVSNSMVTVVVSAVNHDWHLRAFAADAAIASVTGITNACLALIGVALIGIDPVGLTLLLIPGAVLLFAYHNIVQRRRAEEELEKSELRFRALVQNSADVVAVIDDEGFVGYVTPSVERVLSRPMAAVHRRSLFDLLHEEDVEAARGAMSNVLTAAGTIGSFVARASEVDGSARWLEVTLHNLTHDPSVEAIVANLRDVTTRLRAEEETRESEERLQSILDHANAAVFIKDLEGRYQLVNRRVEEIHHRVKYDIIGRTDEELWPDLADAITANDRKVIETLTPLSVEETLREARGERTYLSIKFPMFDTAGNATGICGISTDVTDSKRIEERLFQSEKMQAVGQLAGGIAHDFNNLLAIIQNYTRFIIDELPGDSPIRDDAEEIAKAGATAASLTRQLLAFSRKEIYQPDVVDLDEVVQSTCNMLRPAITPNIELELKLDGHLRNVRIDTGRMEQVIMNLAINARDAMKSGGTLTIATTNSTREVCGVPGQKPKKDDYVVLTVADTGTGIPPDVMPHIFEPFFTTKSRDQGTGLGLASVYGIVEESGGHIEVDSTTATGTRFKVYLPSCDAVTRSADDRVELPSGEGLRILLAEDERGVRNIAQRILTAHGYEVVAAASGDEALELWRNDPSPFDLLLADVIMPDVSGKELSETTGLNTLFMSGYTDQIIGAEGLLTGDVAFLPKPFTAEELLSKVADARVRVLSA
jgi:PAS domain S-box-containing protein